MLPGKSASDRKFCWATQDDGIRARPRLMHFPVPGDVLSSRRGLAL